MELMAYTPFERQIDRLFNEAMKGLTWREESWAPRWNIYEDANGFYVEAGVPGMESKDVEVVVEDGVLTIKGEWKREEPEAKRTYYARELGGGKFARSFTVPSDIDDTKATATCRNGLLRVEFPKREEAKPRRILIEPA